MDPCPSALRRAVVVAVAACGLAGLAPSPLPAADAAELKAQADRWVELEKKTADERAEWRTQKEVLAASVGVLEKERAALRARLEANELAAGLFNTKVDNARAELAAHETAHAALARGCAALEDRLRTLLVRLPEPLQDKVRPLLEAPAPADGGEIAVSERARKLAAALTAIDQFNNSLTLTHHLRKDEAGGDVFDVKVLYWGLATGYGIDARGTRAWVLTPGASGWQWREEPVRVKEIGTLLAVYEKRHTPELVVLPAGGEGAAP